MKVAIKDLGEIITGNTPSKSIPDFWNSKDIYFIKPDIISDENINYIKKSKEYISNIAEKKARVVYGKAIFVTCIGSIGKIGVIESGKYAFNQQINAIVPNENINIKYLAYNLLFNKKRLEAIANAPVVPIINKKQFGDFTINIERDKIKQEKITKVLDKISIIIDKRKQELIQLDNLIQSRFVELFGDAVYNDKKWETDTVKNLCKEIYGGGTPSKAHPEYYKDGNIPWVSAKDMKTDVLKDSQIKINQLGVDNSTARLVPVNSVIMVIRSGILKHTLPVAVNKVPITVNQDLKVFIPGERILTRFLAVQFKMQEKDILSGVRAVTADNIEFNSLKQRRMIVPPIDLQQKYLMFLERIDKSKFVIHKFLYCATHNTQSIIKPRPNTKESGKIRGRETTCRRILTF